MEFKGTKGEWEVYKENPEMILNDSGAYKPNSMLKYSTRKQELFANAKLIAAAPELLKALQTCLRRIKNESHEPFAILEAEEAINKALK